MAKDAISIPGLMTAFMKGFMTEALVKGARPGLNPRETGAKDGVTTGTRHRVGDKINDNRGGGSFNT